MPEPPGPTDAREAARLVARAVVREHASDGDAAAAKPDERVAQKGRTGPPALRSTDFHKRDARRIVNGDVHVFIADAAVLHRLVTMAYLQSAFEKSSDEAVRAQARGWRIFKATEGGPGNTVLYVYFIDPTVMGADYGIGKILADAYPEQVAEIWKLYTSSVTGGGSLLNLAPVKPAAPPPLPPVVPQKP